MDKTNKWFWRLWNILVVTWVTNMYYICSETNIYIAIKVIVSICAVLGYIVMNIVPSFYHQKKKKRRHRICANGCELLITFLVSLVPTIMILIKLVSTRNELNKESVTKVTIYVLLAIISEAIVFWNGIIRVYVTSVQLGIKQRAIGIICGWIPVANIIALMMIINTVAKEVEFENKKVIENELRNEKQICKTKYPLLMVHGVFFRDFKNFNYWGRIPDELEMNGATVFYGNHQSALSVAESAEELLERIKEICTKKKCEKLNIIAHSKGGLDCRYAIEHLGAGKYVASLTTINTPHRGCEFADYLLSKIPQKQQDMIANTYNSGLKKLGDEAPDFIAAVTDLTASECKKRNELEYDINVYNDILCQSVGSKLNVARSGRFPLNFSQPLVKNFDGANDGLVGEKSFEWGENFDFITVKGRRGVSHGDMIDLNRENIYEFDVREYFVNLVKCLKEKGL